MWERSVAHAFADMNARVFTEAQLKAEELLPAVRGALVEIGSILSEEEQEEIRLAERAVEHALIGGEANVLKGAVERLDQDTESLAARLVEKAIKEG